MAFLNGKKAIKHPDQEHGATALLLVEELRTAGLDRGAMCAVAQDVSEIIRATLRSVPLVMQLNIASQLTDNRFN
jgi:hypothetical protein